jgi:hypothetical protein
MRDGAVVSDTAAAPAAPRAAGDGADAVPVPAVVEEA